MWLWRLGSPSVCHLQLENQERLWDGIIQSEFKGLRAKGANGKFRLEYKCPRTRSSDV